MMFVQVQSKMKVHVAIAILVVTSTHFESMVCAKKMNIAEIKEALKPISRSCKTKTGLSDELLAGTMNGLWPRDRSLMCYFKCAAVTLKLMTKEGELTISNINKQLNMLIADELVPRVKEILESCLATVIKSNDACEFAFDMMVCSYNIDPELYFLP
ncbi:uncharacterized protein LOC131671347 [Phymastichus coffea]|uniref:uncharacterized protein LOC131671347 n=1 Tax=Phymastichus coffea TaxID=108790 RepID=UPI00273B2F24|nr:uncharacterized protein LOC131671347 [Phymastichus coffea]